MSLKFRIKNIAPKADKEGDSFVRFSGKAEPYSQSSERECQELGVDGAGNPVLVFTTGLDIEKVDLYRWYTEEEKKEVKKQIKEALPILHKAYGGEKVLHPENKFFWKKKREINRLVVTHEIENYEFDTKNPAHLLLYLSIIGGAFMDIVAPSKNWIQSNPSFGIIHYLELETEDNEFDGEEEITRSDAHAALGEMRKEESGDALFILAWCLQYDTTAFGAYLKSTSQRNLINYHIKYIDGHLKLKGVRKKNFPKSFIEYVERWKGQQTRPKLFTEAYVKAGEYYSFINQREKKYVLSNGTTLGNTIAEAVENLHKPKFQQDYEYLRDSVEAKWKE